MKNSVDEKKQILDKAKKQALDDVSASIDELDKDQEKSYQVQSEFEKQNALFLETAGCDDGNEEHSEEMDPDLDGVRGQDRGEELDDIERYRRNFVDIESFRQTSRELINNSPNLEELEKKIEKIYEKIENVQCERPDSLDENF